VYVSPAGTPYLIYKSDNNSSPAFGPTIIWSQQLAPDGLTPAGRPVPIFAPDQPWQHRLVEAPDMVTANGRTWLFFSAGVGYFNPQYAIGYAACAGPQGPCVDHDPRPLLASNAQGVGPGEESLFTAGGAYWLVYDASSVDDGSARSVAVAPLRFGPRGPSIGASAAGGARTGPRTGHTQPPEG
jgi:beta-xylosidase